ncbi:MAG: EAL domain-containing protein [Candidatus Nanopelagicales bacterium]
MPATGVPDRASRPLLSPAQWVTAIVVLVMVVGLLAASVWTQRIQAEREATLARTEAVTTNSLYILRETMNFTSTLQAYVEGQSTRREVQIARALLERRLSVVDQSGEAGGARTSDQFRDDLATLDAAVAEAPAGTLPLDDRTRLAASVQPAIDAFQSAARRDVDVVAGGVRDQARAFDENQRTAGNVELALLVGSLVLGLGLMVWIAHGVRDRYRAARSSLLEEEHKLDAARAELERLGALDRGQALVLELVATGAPLTRVFESIAAYVSESSHGATVRVSWGNRTLSHPRGAAAGITEAVAWSRQFAVNGASDGRLDILGPSTDAVDAYSRIAALRGCDLARLAVERDSSAQRLEFQASHDPLTGLVNRHALVGELDEHLRTATAYGRHLAVMFCDLDRFKQVNDTLGHAAGDRLLVEVAGRLRASVRDGDIVARHGGDEFVLLCPALDTQEAAVRMAERVRQSLSAPYDLDGHDVVIGVSVGVAFADQFRRSAVELLRASDLAMYRAKQRGGSHVTVFDRTFEADVAATLDLDSALARALVRREMSVLFQPLVRMDDGRIEGFEALLRWTHDGTAYPPDVFIPLAERNGAIVEIGRWVLGEALSAVRGWHGVPGAEDVRVSVNVSARELLEEDFADSVLAAVAASGVPAHLVVLELTEHALVDVRAAHPMLSRLRSAGITVSLDDFGTGYSSLTQLRILPVDQLKLDRSFTQALDRADDRQRALVESVVQLSQGLALDLVVEGVETEAERDALIDLGVERGQGYLFSRPVERDVAAMLLVAPGLATAGDRSA